MFYVSGKKVDDALLVDGHAGPHFEMHIFGIVRPVLGKFVSASWIGGIGVVFYIMGNAHSCSSIGFNIGCGLPHLFMLRFELFELLRAKLTHVPEILLPAIIVGPLLG